MDQIRLSENTENRTAMRITLPDGRILSYAKYGKQGGEPIIILHGSPGSRIATEDPIFHRLGIEMIYPERPGYGNSSPNPNANFKSWADDLTVLLDHLGIKKAKIGGESAGGAYVLACIAWYPERFESASLIASVAPPQTPNYKEGMAFANRLGFWLNKYTPFLVRWSSQNFARGVQRNPEKIWQQIGKQLCASDKGILEQARENGHFQVFQDHITEAFKNGVAGHVADMRNISGSWDIPFDQIKCPIYIWHGEADTLSPIAGAKAMANWLPNTKSFFIPSGGHLLMDQKDVAERILRRMLDEMM